MKLQRVTNRKRGDKEYHKWQVTLPPDVIESLGWNGGDELEAEATTDLLILKRTSARNG